MIKLTTVVVALLAVPTLAHAADENGRSGLRVELRAGYETPTISNGAVYKLGNSASIGGEVGYDIPLGTVTVGPFANYEYASASACTSGNCLGSDGNIAAGGRLGIDIGSRGQLYAKAGYDRFRLKGNLIGASGIKTLDGVMGAIGYDHAVSRQAYLGVELDYADLGSFAGAHFQRRHAAVTAGYRF